MPNLVLDNPRGANGIVLDNPASSQAGGLAISGVPATLQSFDDNLTITLMSGVGDETVTLNGITLTPDSQSASAINFTQWPRLHELAGGLRYAQPYTLLVSGSNGSDSASVSTNPEQFHDAQTIAGWDGVGGAENDLFDNDTGVDNGNMILSTFLLGDGSVLADGKVIVTSFPATVRYWVVTDAWSTSVDETFDAASTNLQAASAFSFQTTANLIGRGAAVGAGLFSFASLANLVARGRMQASEAFNFATTANLGSTSTGQLAGASAFSFQASANLRAAAGPGISSFSFSTIAQINGAGRMQAAANFGFATQGNVGALKTAGGTSLFRFIATARLTDKARTLLGNTSALFPQLESYWELKPGDVVDFAMVWGNVLLDDAQILTSTWTVEDNANALDVVSDSFNTGDRIRYSKTFGARTVAHVALQTNEADVGDLVKLRNTITTTDGQTLTATQFVSVVALYSNEQPQAA